MKRFIKPIYAHCDGPCGHYEMDTLKNSWQTCVKLADKLQVLSQSDLSSPEHLHTFARLTQIKEEHAQICKTQIGILWSDYFKPVHFERYSSLMDDLRRMAQTCSQVKQKLGREAVDELGRQVEALDKIFQAVQQDG